MLVVFPDEKHLISIGEQTAEQAQINMISKSVEPLFQTVEEMFYGVQKKNKFVLPIFDIQAQTSSKFDKFHAVVQVERKSKDNPTSFQLANLVMKVATNFLSIKIDQIIGRSYALSSEDRSLKLMHNFRDITLQINLSKKSNYY
jgi:hypothetical protein